MKHLGRRRKKLHNSSSTINNGITASQGSLVCQKNSPGGQRAPPVMVLREDGNLHPEEEYFYDKYRFKVMFFASNSY